MITAIGLLILIVTLTASKANRVNRFTCSPQKAKADSFVKTVLADNNSIIIRCEEEWPWMAQEEWRDYVYLELLKRPDRISDCNFKPPIGDNGWMFCAHLNMRVGVWL